MVLSPKEKGGRQNPSFQHTDKQAHILVPCPQCGAEMHFLERAHVVRCRFCGSHLYVSGKEGILRYALPTKMAEAERAREKAIAFLRRSGVHSARPTETFLFHAPFWRVQGFVFRWIFGQRPITGDSGECGPVPMERIKELQYRVLDRTVPGFLGIDIGLSSLGVRAQVLEIQPIGSRHDREFLLPVQVPLTEIESLARRMSEDLPLPEEIRGEVILHRVVGARFSVVYLPIWLVELQDRQESHTVVVDAVGADLVSSVAHGSRILFRPMQVTTSPPITFGEIRFLPFRCPNCGWPFPFLPFSVLHFCSTCHRLWCEGMWRWEEVPYSVVPPPKGKSWDHALWIPFWRFRVVIEAQGSRVETLAELYRITPPVRSVSQVGAPQGPIHFYVPAVGLRNPHTMYNIASRLTLAQPRVNPEPFEGGLRPRTLGGSLPMGQAVELGPVILGAMIPPRNKWAVEWLKICRLELSEPTVLYFPFEKANLYLKELCTGLAFQQSALSAEALDGVGW